MITDIKNYKRVFQAQDEKEITFRIPQKADVDALLEFINKLADEDTFISVRKKKTKKEEVEYLAKITQALKKKKGLTITAFYQNKVVANGEVNRMGERREHVGLLGVSVARDFRGQGIGEWLMKELIRIAKGVLKVKLITLEVFSNNSRAINLYQKLGFKECGRLPEAINYKNKFVDNIIMYLKLN